MVSYLYSKEGFLVIMLNHELFLGQILKKLDAAISRIHENLSAGEKDIAGMQEYYWQNYTEMDEYGYENYDNQRSLFLQENANQEQRLLLSRYEKMKDSPYFGRIDFLFDGDDEAESFYIGIANFSEKGSFTPLIYDWRAPISSLFYDYDAGKAAYSAPSGTIEGTILAKGQYKIRHGRIIYAFDCDVKIDDEILSRELSSKGSTSLKNIIQTIQREQNTIIRNTSDKIMVIQGVAGSGKTSVALHRIAYLLYHDREHLKSKNVLILSPNGIFSDYISHILPELGEENILEMSFDTFAYRELKEYIRDTNERSDLIEALISGEENPNGYFDKITPDFVGEIDTYCILLEDELLHTRDITIKRWTKSAREIEELFYYKFTDFPLLSRMKVVSEYVIDEYETLTQTELAAEEKDEIHAAFMAMFETTDLYVIYSRFLQSLGFAPLPDVPFEQRRLPYADVYPMLYMKYTLLSHQKHKQIKHLCIDEMQDYSYLQYRILSLLFDCKMTIVGDKAQTLDSAPRDVTGYIKNCFGKGIKTLELNKSYRNTSQIARYAAAIISDGEKIASPNAYFERNGSDVVVESCSDTDEACSKVCNLLGSYDFASGEGPETIAIITYTEAEASYIYKKAALLLPKHCEAGKINLVDRSSMHFKTGISIIPYYMAKGLEFDEVFFIRKDKKPASEAARELLRQAEYIAATRALHKLFVYDC